MSHIDPATGRNKRETGKLLKRAARSEGRGNQIRRSNGQPTERRIDQVRRNRVSPMRFPASPVSTEAWERGPDAYRSSPEAGRRSEATDLAPRVYGVGYATGRYLQNRQDRQQARRRSR